MKGDFTRLTFRPVNHFSGVLLQQGRVQVDADWNEQVDIVRHREETTSGDVIGARGGPMHDAGFALTCQGTSSLTDCAPEDIRIGYGRYYVDGILCENHEEVALDSQPDLPGVALPTAAGTYLAYLDVWDRHLTSFERPDIKEVALGGPDTATRTQTVWQVRLLPVGDPDTCLDFGPGWEPPGRESTGALSAQGAPQAEEAVDCLVPAGAGYRRIENQLYRVEIHDEGALGIATFTWSRDNGSVVARLADIDGSVVTINAPSKDVELRFADAAAIELATEEQALRGEPGILVEVSKVEGNQITVKAWPGGTGPTMADFIGLPSVRRWEAEVASTSPTLLDLEDGVQVAFEAGEYRSGDFWLIPARSVDRTVQWPEDDSGSPVPQPRHGIQHHYCPLALLTLDAQGWSLESDCRQLFPPVTELTSMQYVGGDGQEIMPENVALGLPKSLQVGVENGSWPMQGATVRYQVVAPGSGTLTGVGPDGGVTTNQEGIASAGWQLDPSTESQQASATLVDAEGNAVGLPVVFTANLSVARQVSYDPGSCANLQTDRTVQSAIARLADLASLRYVSGDGQTRSANASQPLESLRVAVSTPCGPVESATVRFAITKGSGTLQAGQSTVNVMTNDKGLAACSWTPDATTYSQQVTATLMQAGGRTIIAPAAVTFTTNLSSAGDVTFDPSNCEGLGEADTVQEAIDLLCAGVEGAVSTIRIERVTLLGGPPLDNDVVVTSPQLSKGISIFCGGDAPIDPQSVDGKPVCIVTVNLPYPFDEAEMAAWNTDTVFGFRPTIIDGISELREEEEIRWRPTEADHVAMLMGVLQERGRPDPVLAHVVVKGNLVWGKTAGGLVYLDGDAFGASNGGLVLPSGDGRRGGDFEMWFRIGG